MKNRSIVCLSEPNPIPIGGRKWVTPQNILMLVADINYTTVYLFNGDQFMIATTHGKVQKSLDPHGNFVRVSRKCTVNWEYVRRYCATELRLENNQIIPFSRRKGKMIVAAMVK